MEKNLEIDENKVQELINEVDTNSAYFKSLYKNLIDEETSAMDSLMSDIYVECIRQENASIDVLTKYYLELSNMVYFMNSRVEKLGIMADMSKSAYNATYNNNLLSASEIKDEKGKARAAAICTAEAQMKSYHDEIVADVYRHAYNAVKSKVLSAQDLMNAIRRILSTRTEEMKLANAGVGGDN